MKEITIKKIFNFNKNNQELKYVFISKDSFLKIPVKNDTDTIELNSKIYKMNEESLIESNDNIVKTHKIKDINYKGPVDLFFYHEKKTDFNVPNHFKLTNEINKSYFIDFQNLKGNLQKGEANTNKFFTINHRDFFISGDNLDIKNSFDNFTIKNNSTVIQKKNNLHETTITSEYSNFIESKNEAIFKKNVRVKKKNIKTFSDFLKIFLAENSSGKNDIEKAIFKKNVFFSFKKNSKIRSKNAYFFQKQNIFIFCDEVEVEDEKGFSKNNLYIYDITKEELKNIQNDNLFLLKKIIDLDPETSNACKEYIPRKPKFIIKNEKSE